MLIISNTTLKSMTNCLSTCFSSCHSSSWHVTKRQQETRASHHSYQFDWANLMVLIDSRCTGPLKTSTANDPEKDVSFEIQFSWKWNQTAYMERSWLRKQFISIPIRVSAWCTVRSLLYSMDKSFSTDGKGIKGFWSISTELKTCYAMTFNE